MIYDRIEHAGNYDALGEPYRRALRILAEYPPDSFQPGRLVVDGDRLFLVQADYQTEGLEMAVMEAHRKYADIMIVLEGEEKILFQPTAELRHLTQAYDPDSDALLAEPAGHESTLHLTPGHFVIFWPQDAHCPGLDWNGHTAVRKVIAKVRLDNSMQEE